MFEERYEGIGCQVFLGIISEGCNYENAPKNKFYLFRLYVSKTLVSGSENIAENYRTVNGQLI